jgi:hypothetical protein
MASSYACDALISAYEEQNCTHQLHPSIAPINCTHQLHPSIAPINCTLQIPQSALLQYQSFRILARGLKRTLSDSRNNIRRMLLALPPMLSRLETNCRTDKALQALLAEAEHETTRLVGFVQGKQSQIQGKYLRRNASRWRRNFKRPNDSLKHLRRGRDLSTNMRYLPL